MKTYYVIWTYIANYSKIQEVKAAGPLAAAQQVLDQYSEDFQKKATVYVFTDSPAVTSTPADRS